MNGFYINLKERTDRDEHFKLLKKKYKFFNNLTRLEAIYHKNGHIGCALSHKSALEKCLWLPGFYFLICEDDLCILNHENFLEFTENVKKNLNQPWDVIVLTPRGDCINESINNIFYRINNNQTTTGYIIKKTSIPKLISCIDECIEGLSKGKDTDFYAFDQYWKNIQHELRFYYFKKIFAGQIVGYSDIQKCVSDYNHRYLNQT